MFFSLSLCPIGKKISPIFVGVFNSVATSNHFDKKKNNMYYFLLVLLQKIIKTMGKRKKSLAPNQRICNGDKRTKTVHSPLSPKMLCCVSAIYVTKR
jgi:hypothetical protein